MLLFKSLPISATSKIPPGAIKLITIKRPVAIKVPNMMRKVSTVVSSENALPSPSSEFALLNPPLQPSPLQSAVTNGFTNGDSPIPAVTFNDRPELPDTSQPQPNSSLNVSTEIH